MRPDLARDILRLTTEHLLLVAIALAIAVAVGVPLGIVLTREPSLRRWLLGFASVMQTIPRKPNNARLGMVCITLAKPSSQRRNEGSRVNTIPRGTPTATAIASAIATSRRCSVVKRRMSRARSGRMILLILENVQEGPRFRGL